jgi:hypothetical protein
MTAEPAGDLVVAARFNGPPGSGNGGYVAGLVASRLLAARTGAIRTGGIPAAAMSAGAGPAPAGSTTPVEVTLRRPPPLEVPMRLDGDGDGLRLTAADAVVAEAAPGTLTATPPTTVGVEQAGAAAGRYAGFTAHPFPRCFTCGPERAPADGLRLFPGAVPGLDGTTACPWVPDASLAGVDTLTMPPEVVWAALDCPGGWTLDLVGRPAVLGRITAEILRPPLVADRHVVMGRLLRQEGRKAYTATALYDPAGTLLARAEQVWIAVDPAAFQRR